MSNFLIDLNHNLASLSHNVLESLVQIHSGHLGRHRGAGAGTIWHENGLIITNAHVVQSRRQRMATAGDLTVTLHDGRNLPARILAIDPDHDLAALRIDADQLPAIEVGEARNLHPGDIVVAFGFPWGIAGGATSGVVIGVGNTLPELSGTNQDWLAASLHLRPGHSGGPMVDSHGRLVGINTLMTGPDVGVAIPVHVAVRFLKSVLDESKPHAQRPNIPTVTV